MNRPGSTQLLAGGLELCLKRLKKFKLLGLGLLPCPPRLDTEGEQDRRYDDRALHEDARPRHLLEWLYHRAPSRRVK